jgi:hypothetical protein
MSLPKKIESIINYLADEKEVATLQTSLRLILADLHSLASNMKQAQSSHSATEMAASIFLPSAFKAMKDREEQAAKAEEAKAAEEAKQKELDKAKAFEMDSGEFF